MKKITSLLQNISGYICLVVFALLFVYALGMATPAAPLKSYEDTRVFYSGIMPYNNAMLLLSIFGLIICAFYYVLRNNARLVYYVSNFVWFGIYGVYTLVTAIVSLVGIIHYQVEFSKIPFDTINTYFAERNLSLFVRSNTPVFVLGYLEVVILLLTIVPVVLVVLDKVKGRIRYENNRKLGVSNPVTYDPQEVK